MFTKAYWDAELVRCWVIVEKPSTSARKAVFVLKAITFLYVQTVKQNPELQNTIVEEWHTVLNSITERLMDGRYTS